MSFHTSYLSPPLQPASSTLSLESVEFLARAHFAHFEEKFNKVYASIEHREKAFVTFVRNIGAASKREQSISA